MWVENFRNSELSLGEVIRDTMQRRGSHWSSRCGDSRGQFTTPGRGRKLGKGGSTPPRHGRHLSPGFGQRQQQKRGQPAKG